jgi:hypothetical protein
MLRRSARSFRKHFHGKAALRARPVFKTRQNGLEFLEDRLLLAATFEIGNLFTTGASLIEHAFVTGDDRGGIAISDSHVFYTGGGGTGSFSADDLSGGTNVGMTFDALTSNLLDGTVYSLGTDATTP